MPAVWRRSSTLCCTSHTLTSAVCAACWTFVDRGGVQAEILGRQHIDYGVLHADNQIRADGAGSMALKLDAVPHLTHLNLGQLGVCAAGWTSVDRGQRWAEILGWQCIDCGLLCVGNEIGADDAGSVASKLDAVPHLTPLDLCSMRSWLDFSRQRGEGGAEMWLAVCRQWDWAQRRQQCRVKARRCAAPHTP